MKVSRAALLVALFSLLPISPYAQSASGAILGDIVDTTGARLPAATIKVVSQQRAPRERWSVARLDRIDSMCYHRQFTQ